MGDLNQATIHLSDSYLDITGATTKDQMPQVLNLNKEAKAVNSSNSNNASSNDYQSSIHNDEASVDSLTKHSLFNDSSALKKPCKILPCPRCKSLNTKFCYFNNHNINQPRHFCKNCQRYWTSGGSMRNVPVGSGKRKSKHSVNLVVTEQDYEKPSSSFSITPSCAKIDSPNDEIHESQTCFPLQGFPGPPWSYPWTPSMILAPPNNVPFPIFPFFPIFPNVSNLGKHCRGEMRDEEKTIWIPKTLRIDNPEEAAKSSIWATLGIKRGESVKRDGLFQGFQSNNENSGYGASNAVQILHSNPAALARSQTFQESA